MKLNCRIIFTLAVLLPIMVAPVNGDPTVPEETIYGHVYDSDTGNPVSGAWVRCEGKTETTDAEGYYAIEGGFAPSTSYTLTCYASGYPDSSKTVTTDSYGKAKSDFHLGSEEPIPKPTPPGKKPELNIFETLTAAEHFCILMDAISFSSCSIYIGAVEFSSFTELLSHDYGPFTLFAPKDPTGPPHDVMEIAALSDALAYHVVFGEYEIEDLAKMRSIASLSGEDITITVTEDSLMVNDAAIVQGDIKCSNGIIHVIDAILVPETAEGIIEPVPASIPDDPECAETAEEGRKKPVDVLTLKDTIPYSPLGV